MGWPSVPTRGPFLLVFFAARWFEDGFIGAAPGPHEIAHLRAIAQGLDALQLEIDHSGAGPLVPAYCWLCVGSCGSREKSC